MPIAAPPSRPAGTMSWVCKSCQTHNWETRQTCRACGMPPWPTPSAKKLAKKKGAAGNHAKDGKENAPPAPEVEPATQTGGTQSAAAEVQKEDEEEKCKTELAELRAAVAALGKAESPAAVAARQGLESSIEDAKKRLLQAKLVQMFIAANPN